MKDPKEINYVPGICNIGQDEIRRRYRIGFKGLVLMIIYILFVKFLDLPQLYKLGLFISAFYCVSGFIQAYSKFCFVYGWKGVASLYGKHNFQKITDEIHLRHDRNRTIILVLTITCISGILTALYFFLPW